VKILPQADGPKPINPEDARLIFNQVVKAKLPDIVDISFKFYKQVTDTPLLSRISYHRCSSGKSGARVKSKS
jgi:hypothetical protein